MDQFFQNYTQTLEGESDSVIMHQLVQFFHPYLSKKPLVCIKLFHWDIPILSSKQATVTISL